MKYSYPQIVLQEVPDELSLALSISGCDIGCQGCHSTETWNSNFGKDLTTTELERLFKKHKHVSCVLFYGGEWNLDQLVTLIKYTKYKGLNVCLYTGRELDFFNNDFLRLLDYIKTGPFKKSLGGLNSKTTNQKFYKLKNGIVEKDLTFIFSK